MKKWILIAASPIVFPLILLFGMITALWGWFAHFVFDSLDIEPNVFLVRWREHWMPNFKRPAPTPPQPRTPNTQTP